MARCLERFEARTGVPVVVNTSLNTAGRPMVDDPRDALECFGSAPVDVARHRAVPDPARPRRARRRSCVDRDPHGRPAEPGRRCSTPCAGAEARIVVVDDRRDRAARRSPSRRRPRGARRRPRPGGGAQRGLAGDGRATGWPSSTTTSCPSRAGAAHLVADLAAAAARRRRGAGPDRRAAARRSAADRLGAGHHGARGRALGDRRHRLPARRARGRRRLRRALPARLPRGRRPGAARAPPRAGGSCPGAARCIHPVRPAPAPCPCGGRPATRTTC